MQRERKLERDDETLATVLASSESQARAFRKSVAGKEREVKGREEGEGNKGPNLGRNLVWRSRGERERQSFTVWTTLMFFFFSPLSNNCPVCPRLPLLT
jgi:hypothetical protein